jgi:hypothetical protein
MFPLNMRNTAILIFILTVPGFSCEDSSGDSATLIGKGGSLARFAVTDTHLYAVDDKSLNVYQIMEDGALGKINAVYLDEGVETIFAYGESLYIGTNSAMLTFDITNPSDPAFVSSYSHIVGCDPVVVQDTLAYVTLRVSECRPTGSNTLDIINIKNPSSPVLLSNYTLDSPYGLGVDGNLLFVCEANQGLKILDISNPFNARLIKTYTNEHAYDVIPHDGLLIMTGNDGVAQYDYTDHLNIKKLSLIRVQ